VEQFWVIRDRQRSGPFSEAEILRAYRGGELKGTDLLWAEGVPAPVTVAEAFAQMRAQEPVGEIDFTLVPADDLDQPGAADTSPYRPPLANVDDLAGAQVRYAGFWVRYSAYVLDAIILGLLMVVVAFAMAAATTVLGVRLLESHWVSLVTVTLLGWLYFALGESGSASATPGKRAFHLQVLGAGYADRISFLRATGRFLGRYLSSFLLLVGYLIQPFNARKRALHDFLSGTVVVVEHPYSRFRVAAMIVVSLVLPVLGGAAVALPAYRDYATRVKVTETLRQVRPATVAVQRYVTRTGQVPASLAEAGFDTRRALAGAARLAFDSSTGAITVTFVFEPVEDSTVLIVPRQIVDGAIVWGCQPGTLPPRLLPKVCPPGG
jgi:uncharacterized RDD family membrane protein YckC